MISKNPDVLNIGVFLLLAITKLYIINFNKKTFKIVDTFKNRLYIYSGTPLNLFPKF